MPSVRSLTRLRRYPILPCVRYLQLSAVELARLIRAKELSARDVVGAHLAQIERVNPRVNAIVTLVADRAMERARAADEALARGAAVGPLHGLPIAHKDLQPTKGIRTTFGSPIYKDFVPAEDSLLVERLRARRRDRDRQDEHAGVRRRIADVQPGVRLDAESVRPDEDLRRQQRRRRGRARVRHAADRRRQRHGRLAPQPRQLLQRRRSAAVAGPRAGLAGGDGVVDAERRRPDGAQRRGRRADAERDRRSRSPVADRARATRRRVRGAARPRLQRRARRLVDAISAGCRSIRASGTAVERAARACSNRSAASSRTPSPTSPTSTRCSRRCERWRS